MTTNELKAWASCRNTSDAIAEAIHECAEGGSYRTPESIWEAPTEIEQNAVLEHAFDLTNEDTLHWGDEKFTREPDWDAIREDREEDNRNASQEERSYYDD